MNDVQFKVGDTVFVFDENRRVYSQPTAEERKRGKLYGEIIYRRHFGEYKIVGETPRSWIVGTPGFQNCDMKFPKKRDMLHRFYSDAEVDDAVWVHENRHKLALFLNTLDADKLREVAKLVGYNDGQGG
jgi:hypothetical protein